MIDNSDFLAQIRLEQRLLEREYGPLALAARATIAPRVAALLSASKALREQLQPGTGPIRLIDGAEIWKSLASAVVSIARARRGCRLNPKDLKDLVEEHGPREDLAFWASQYPPRVVGLLKLAQRPRGYFSSPRDSDLPELRRLIEDLGVMFWDEERDKEWRLVDTKWLTAHGDIRQWITYKWPGGQRCRFCATLENPQLNVLHAIELERRAGVAMVGDIESLPMGAMLTHERCRPHLLQWLRIASAYKTQEQAEAADAAAGRKPCWATIVKQLGSSVT